MEVKGNFVNKKLESRSLKEIFEFLLGLIILIVLGYVLFKIAIISIHMIKSFFEEYTAIAVALVTGLLAFLSAVGAKYLENSLVIKNKIRNERQDFYVKFLDWIITNFLYGDVPEESDIVDSIKECQKHITIYGSDKVLKAWSNFKNITMNTVLKRKDISNEERLKIYINKEAIYLEKLLLAMRKDLGYKNKNIKEFDILKLYINDINKYL